MTLRWWINSILLVYALFSTSCTKIETHRESAGIEQCLQVLKDHPQWYYLCDIRFEIFGDNYYISLPYDGEPALIKIHGKIIGYCSNYEDTPQDIYFRLVSDDSAIFYKIDSQTGNLVKDKRHRLEAYYASYDVEPEYREYRLYIDDTRYYCY